MRRLKEITTGSVFSESPCGTVKPFPGFSPAVFIRQMRGREVTPGNIRSAIKWMLDQAYFPRYLAHWIVYVYTPTGNQVAVMVDLGDKGMIVVPLQIGPNGRVV